MKRSQKLQKKTKKGDETSFEVFTKLMLKNLIAESICLLVLANRGIFSGGWIQFI